MIVSEYIDRAKKGTNDNRPAFQQMLYDSKQRTFEAVLVYKLDRFARNRYDMLLTLWLNEIMVLRLFLQLKIFQINQKADWLKMSLLVLMNIILLNYLKKLSVSLKKAELKVNSQVEELLMDMKKFLMK